MNVIFAGDGISAGTACFFAQQDVPVQGLRGDKRPNFFHRHVI
jgi:hypothetical protein